mgnify:CR=1 FL=1
MALFGLGKRKEEKKVVDAPKAAGKAPKKPTNRPMVIGVKDVLLRPRITEKAANLTSMNVYTFDVRTSANKGEIADAVKKLYKVTPIKIRVVNNHPKLVAMRRKRGFGKTAATRKAYVYLKKGEEIQFT